MLVEEIRAIAKNFLRGDNTNAEIADSTILFSVKEVCMRCEPHALIAIYDDTKTDVFRRLLGEYEEPLYIKKPVIENGAIAIDEDLQMAIVFFVCSYYSFKNKDYYEKKAEYVVGMYKSNNENLM